MVDGAGVLRSVGNCPSEELQWAAVVVDEEDEDLTSKYLGNLVKQVHKIEIGRKGWERRHSVVVVHRKGRVRRRRAAVLR